MFDSRDLSEMKKLCAELDNKYVGTHLEFLNKDKMQLDTVSILGIRMSYNSEAEIRLYYRIDDVSLWIPVSAVNENNGYFFDRKKAAKKLLDHLKARADCLEKELAR